MDLAKSEMNQEQPLPDLTAGVAEPEAYQMGLDKEVAGVSKPVVSIAIPVVVKQGTLKPKDTKAVENGEADEKIKKKSKVANKLCTLASFVVPKKRGNQSTSEAAGEKSVLGKPEINIPKEALLRGLWKTDPKQLGVVKAELERANKERFWEEFSGALPEAAKLLEEIIAAEQ